MNNYDRRLQVLAACLSTVAGYVDAVCYLHLNGFFVSFMSGNSTRAGAGLALGSTDAMIATGLIGVFLLGVAIGSLVLRAAKRARRAAVLAFVALLLSSAALLGTLGASSVCVGMTTVAMGAANAVFERDGEVHIGVTYMTGSLVKLGQKLTAACLGGDRYGWVPYLMLWGGFISGATLGALAFPHLGLSGLWVPAASIGMLAAMAFRIDRSTA